MWSSPQKHSHTAASGSEAGWEMTFLELHPGDGRMPFPPSQAYFSRLLCFKIKLIQEQHNATSLSRPSDFSGPT